MFKMTFLRPSFGEPNGLFFDSENDKFGRQWVKVIVQDNEGQYSVLTMSSFEMRILCKQFKAICDEHGWAMEV
mgnify:CR=1 FL=1